MAYMVDGKGPYPNKAGEYCGNYYKGRRVPPNTRVGRAHPCKAGTTAEMEAQGYVGLYLVSDEDAVEMACCNRGKEIVEVPTPPELLEPVAGGE